MGFWGSLGKGLLKAAPIAANFIPGVGPIAGALISGAAGAGAGALGGGGIRGAVTGGIEGAQAGYAKGKSTKGIGPSQPPRPSMNNRVGLPDYARNVAGGMSTIGSRDIFDPRQRVPDINKVPERGISGILEQFGDTRGAGPSKGFDWKKLLGQIGPAVGGAILTKKLADANKPKDMSEFGPGEQYGVGSGREIRRDQYSFGQGKDQRAPNLADMISQGRRDAIKSQPWRSAEYERVPDKPMNIYPNAGQKRRKSYAEQAE